MKNKAVYLTIIFLFTLTSCGGWTTASRDINKCDPGNKVDESYDELIIKPDSGNFATVWKSYNGVGCGEEVGQAPGGYEAEWTQIVENSSGEFMINASVIVKEDGSALSGWIECSDISFTGDMEYYLDILPDDGFDLYLDCVNISKQK